MTATYSINLAVVVGGCLLMIVALPTPIGLLVGTIVFMRFYRRSGAVSAYTHLEARFGLRRACTWSSRYACCRWRGREPWREGIGMPGA
jgi:hypothetical protein